jgi:transcription initiation factor IIF auxiliary subunit
MAYKLAQNFKYEGDDWWEWSVWVDASEDEINKIKFVEYTLHPTFPNPVRIIKDRQTKFRLDAAGWGIFTIYGKVVLQNGEKIDMEHKLELLYDDGTPTYA